MTSKLRLDLTFALPELPDAADACVHRLVADLQAQPGIDHVHIHPRPMSPSWPTTCATCPLPWA